VFTTEQLKLRGLRSNSGPPVLTTRPNNIEADTPPNSAFRAEPALYDTEDEEGDDEEGEYDGEDGRSDKMVDEGEDDTQANHLHTVSNEAEDGE